MAGSPAVHVAVLLATCMACMQPGSAVVAVFDGVHAAATTATAGANVLVLTILHNRRSWGYGRTFLEYVELLEGLDFPASQLSVGVLVSEREEFEAVSTAAKTSGFANSVSDFSVMYADSSEKKVPRDQRKDAVFEQVSRRRMIARFRNLAMYSFLKLHHTAVFWVDADVVSVPGDLLKRMVNSGRDIITAHCTWEGDAEDSDFDKNAWAGGRTAPQGLQELTAHCEGQEVFLPSSTPSARYIKDLAAAADADVEFVRLDSVGGTTLYITAEAIRQGVNFPVRHIIGSQWDCEGYDGIETEGLCYMAEPLGFSCWAILHATVVHEGYHPARS